jgi:hypothetical protein
MCHYCAAMACAAFTLLCRRDQPCLQCGGPRALESTHVKHSSVLEVGRATLFKNCRHYRRRKSNPDVRSILTSHIDGTDPVLLTETDKIWQAMSVAMIADVLHVQKMVHGANRRTVQSTRSNTTCCMWTGQKQEVRPPNQVSLRR